MRFFHIYVIVLLTLSANEVLSDFCDHKKSSNGTQIREGSCSKTIQGDIPSVKQMTSTFITSPNNEAVLEANQAFSVDILISHLETGHFSDPEKEYYTKPQSLNRNGVIEGHTHVTIQEINDNPFPPNAENFVFFDGVNVKAKRGHLSVDVVRKDGTPGLPAGRFRICTMAGSLSHQPLLMPVAKRGAQDDCIRIAVNGKGKGAGKGKGKDVGKVKDVGKGKDEGKVKDEGKGKDEGKVKDVGKGKDVGKVKDVGKGKGGAKINKGKKGRRL